MRADLNDGTRETGPFGVKAGMVPRRSFVLNGRTIHVAGMCETFRQEYGSTDVRPRLIHDDGTQSDLLMRSLHRALTKGGASWRIVEPDAGPPLAADAEEGDTRTGTTCILHSPSDEPRIEARRSMPHEIGMTGGSIERRIATARLKPTYLTADVEITRTDKLIHVDRSRFKTLMGGIFDATRTEIEVVD